MSCPGGQLLPPPVRRLQRPSLLVAEGGPLHPPLLPCCIRSNLQKHRRGAGRRQRERELLSGDGECTSTSPGGGPGGESFASKNLDKRAVSLSLGPKRAWRIMDGPTLDHTHPPILPAGSSGRFEHIIKGPTHAPSAKLWNQVSMAPHTQTPLWSAHGPGPCVHLAAPPWVCRWYRWSRLYSVWVPGSATQPVSLAPVDHLTRLCDSVHPASFQVQGCPLHFSEGGRYPWLACKVCSPVGEGCDRAGPSS